MTSSFSGAVDADGLFERADADRDGVVNPRDAVPFFASGLLMTPESLDAVWGAAVVSRGQSALTRENFPLALRLVALHQSNRFRSTPLPLTAESLDSCGPLPPPSFDGVIPAEPEGSEADVGERGEGPGGSEVVVHVYDLATQVNDRLFGFGLGLYHSGVEVVSLGREYWFQGHDFAFTGVVELRHPAAAATVPLRASVSLGRSPLSRTEIRKIVHELSDSYRGNTYNPVSRNCNAFSKEFVARLHTERGFPGYINRVASIGRVVLKVLPERLVWWTLGKCLGASATEDEEEEEAVVANPQGAGGGPAERTDSAIVANINQRLGTAI